MSAAPPLGHVAAVALLVLTGVAAALAVAVGAIHAASARAERRRQSRWARWEPALLDALVGDRRPAEVAALVGPGERGDFFRLVTAYALRLDGESRDRVAEAAAPHLGAALRLLGHRRADRRALAAHLVGLVGGAAERARLLPLLDDAAPGVAMTAARALARSGSPAAVLLVVDATDRFGTWGRAAVASVLAEFGVAAGPALARALADGARGELARTACAEALRRLAYAPAADAAAGLLSAEPSREVRAAALRLLRDVGGPAHAGAVRPLCDSADEVVRLHAVSALAALGSPADAGRLRRALSDESRWVVLRATSALAVPPPRPLAAP